MGTGRFIVLEGGEGAGKSTQARLLAERLATQDIKVHLTREVGGSPLAEKIRALWLADHDEEWDSLTELLLIFAARREHLAKTIWPRLKQGYWIISDRFVASTIVYQGMVMGLSNEAEKLRNLVVGDFKPDLTLLLDVTVALAQERIQSRCLDRYERKDADFHQKLRQSYLSMAERNSDDWRVVDAMQNVDAVQEAVWEAVKPLLAAQ